MPRRRQHSKLRANAISNDAVHAYSRGGFMALPTALGLKPWPPWPLPLDVDPHGVDQDAPPESMTPHQAAAWRHAQELQRQLVAACNAARLPLPALNGE